MVACTDGSVIMNRRNTLRLLAMMISGGSAWNVSANGFRLADQDAFATARGEAFVATADNASAVYYNPAGITQLEGVNVARWRLRHLPVTRLLPLRAQANSGTTYHIDHQLAAVPQSFTTYTPKDWPLSFGLGVYSPYGGDIGWPQDTGFREDGTSGSLTYQTINPVAALKLAPGFSIAGGLMVNYAKLDYDRAFSIIQLLSINFFRL